MVLGKKFRKTEDTDLLHLVHDQCDQDVRFEHYRVNETGHIWPQSLNGVSTHQVIWSFLSEFSKAAAEPGRGAGELPGESTSR